MQSKIISFLILLCFFCCGFSQEQYLLASYYVGTNCHGNVTALRATNSECRQVGSGYQKITCGIAITIYDCTDPQCSYCITTFLTGTCITVYSNNQSVKYTCGSLPPFPNDTYIEYDFSSVNCIGDADVVRAYYSGNCQSIQPPYFTQYTCSEEGITRFQCTDNECSQNCVSSGMSEVCYQNEDGSTYQTCSTPIKPDEPSSNQTNLSMSWLSLVALLCFLFL